MLQHLNIISVVDEHTPLANVFDSIGNLLNSSHPITIYLLQPEGAEKKIDSQLSRSKHMGKYRQEGKLLLQPLGKDGGNIYSGIAVQPGNFYWLMRPEYFAQAQALYRWFEKADTQTIYTLNPPAQKHPQRTRIALRLFNTSRVQGTENGFIAFDAAYAPTLFSLPAITAQNFAWRMATYAALAKLPIAEADVAIPAHPQKVGFWSSLVNAAQNRRQWMVKEPLQALKDKSAGSVWQPNHPLWRLVFFAIAVLGLLVFPILSFSYGITWDEKGDADYAFLVLDYYMSFGKDKTLFHEVDNNVLFGHLLYYGPSFNLLCAFVAKNFSPFGLYETRHIIIALFGFLGIVYAGRIATLLGNRQAGVITMLLLLVSPHFFGHAFNNQKDTPFAAGYIISLYYLICFIRELPKVSRKTVLFTTLAFGFAIGVRIGGLLLPAYLGIAIALWWLWQTFKTGIKTTGAWVLPFAGRYITVLAGSYLAGIFFWPWAMLSPLKNPIKALTQFTNYQNVYNYELFEGKLLFMAEKPWYYLPKYILIQTPLFVWAGLALFLITLLLKIRNKNLWFWLLLVFVAVFPVAYAIIKHSSLYNGWRQFLFVYPPLAVLAALGWQWLVQVFRQPALKAAMFGLLGINILYIAFWMVKNHPNQYVYFNEITGGTKGAYGYYETDYYSNSLKQAADWFTDNVGTDKPYVISTNNETTTAGYYINKQNRDAQVVWSKEHDLTTKQADYAFITSRTMSHYQIKNGIFPPKGTIHAVTVDGVPLVAVVKRENDYQPLADQYYEAKNFDTAIYYGTKAIEYDPKNVEALRLLAQSFISKDSIPPAREYLRRSLQLYPDDYLALELMGEVFFRRKEYDSAEWYFNQSVRYRVNFSKAYINIGVTMFNMKRYDEAVTNFKKAIEYSEETRPDHYTFLAKCYLALKQYDLGLKAGNTALQADPNSAETYFVMASIYKEMGNEEQANAMYVYYLKLTGQF